MFFCGYHIIIIYTITCTVHNNNVYIVRHDLRDTERLRISSLKITTNDHCAFPVYILYTYGLRIIIVKVHVRDAE